MAGAEKQHMERQGHPLGVRIPNAWESEKIRPRRTLSGGGVANNDPVDGGMVTTDTHKNFLKLGVDFCGPIVYYNFGPQK